MAETIIKPNYQISLSGEELRLVTLALAQRLAPADLEAAKRLNVKLCEQRSSVLADMLRVARRAQEQAEGKMTES